MSIEAVIITAVVGLAGALSGGLVSIFTSRGQVAEQVSKAWKEYYEPLQTELRELREKLQTYERGIEALIRQIVCTGNDPVWQPGMAIPEVEPETKPKKKNTGGLLQ